MRPADAPESRVVSQIRIRAILFLVLAIAAGGGAVMLVKRYLDSVRSAEQPAVATANVVVAAMGSCTESHCSACTIPILV